MCSALERRAVQGLVMPSRLRKTLGARNGERFRVTATVDRFGHKHGWVGDVTTILLKDLRDANTDAELADHLWFTAGMWSRDLREGRPHRLHRARDAIPEGIFRPARGCVGAPVG